jgi:hypothetical protein
MTKDDFDIQVGMAVYSAAGEKIGTVSQIAGFGSTRIHEVSAHQADGLATEAGSGTGYLKVDRTEVSGPGAEEVVVPFPRIREVKAGYGVTLIDAAIAQTGLSEVEVPLVDAPKKRWWQGLRSGRKTRS